MQCLNFPCLLNCSSFCGCAVRTEDSECGDVGAVPVDDRYKSPKRDVDQSESREIGSFVPRFSCGRYLIGSATTQVSKG
jgi:hypothetical protein